MPRPVTGPTLCWKPLTSWYAAVFFLPTGDNNHMSALSIAMGGHERAFLLLWCRLPPVLAHPTARHSRGMRKRAWIGCKNGGAVLVCQPMYTHTTLFVGTRVTERVG